MEVALVRWPGEQERLAELRRSGIPRLLIIEEGTGAPVVRDFAEDWIRVPATDADIRARVAALAARVRTLGEQVPELVDEVLVFGNQRTVLSPLESRLAEELVAGFGATIARDALTAAGWPDSEAARNDLDVHILRLRRRIEPLGLVITTVRGKGYVLGAGDPDPAGKAPEVPVLGADPPDADPVEDAELAEKKPKQGKKSKGKSKGKSKKAKPKNAKAKNKAKGKKSKKANER